MASSGNFSTLNPVDFQGAISSFLSNGNLKASTGENVDAHCGGTLGINADTDTQGYYYEVRIESRANNQAVGWTRNVYYTGSYGASGNQSYVMANGKGAGGGDVYTLNSANTSFRQTFSDGDIVGVAIKGGKLWFAKNNTYINSGDPAGNSGEAITGATGTLTPIWYVAGGGTNTQYFNFGQDSTFGGAITAGGNADANGFGDFKYAPPTGFLALCSANLPISADIDPAQTDDDYSGKNFNALAYTGTGSSNAVTGLGFQPDLVWIKNRSGTQGPKLTDSSRGVTKVLQSATTSSESTDSNGLTAFGSDGFTVGSDAGYNGSSNNIIAWCWRANGGTTASNSDGSITSTVQANQAAGFSIVTYTGTGSVATVGHGLGAVPKWIIVKNRDTARNWACYHVSDNDSGTRAILLNTGGVDDSNYWNGTQPTSSVYSVGTETEVNQSSNAMVAYCWADVEGFQKFGSYIGNGSADGPFVYLGFRPKLLVLKRTINTGFFNVFDGTRKTFNSSANPYLVWNNGDVEANGVPIDFYSNGFKPRNTGSGVNQSGTTFIYMAWGDVPFKYNNTF
jgi:hypothetical protein